MEATVNSNLSFLVAEIFVFLNYSKIVLLRQENIRIMLAVFFFFFLLLFFLTFYFFIVYNSNTYTTCTTIYTNIYAYNILANYFSLGYLHTITLHPLLYSTPQTHHNIYLQKYWVIPTSQKIKQTNNKVRTRPPVLV